MSQAFRVEGIEEMPVYLVSTEDPSEYEMTHLVSGVPLLELIARLRPQERLYLVDYASRPGRTRLTRLI